MIPKEKARELFDKYQDAGSKWYVDTTKKYALIAVDEIDEIYQKLTPKDDPYCFLLELEYWQEVKQEIELL